MKQLLIYFMYQTKRSNILNQTYVKKASLLYLD